MAVVVLYHVMPPQISAVAMTVVVLYHHQILPLTLTVQRQWFPHVSTIMLCGRLDSVLKKLLMRITLKHLIRNCILTLRGVQTKRAELRCRILRRMPRRSTARLVLTTNREKLRQSALLRASTNTICIVSVHQRKRFVLARSTLLLPFCAARLFWTPL
jgi:hypothetical protein